MKLKNEYFILLVLGILLLTGVVLLYYQKNNNDIVISSPIIPVKDQLIKNKQDEGDEVIEGDKQPEKKIIVHIAGEVKNPGVYELSEDSRVIDAVKIAGGGTENADIHALNLAAPIYDGEKIYIPSIHEIIQKDRDRTISLEKNVEGLININTANANELMELPGIGPGKASDIISFRNKIGKFKKVEDLLEVNGIGEKTLEQIRGLICVW